MSRDEIKLTIDDFLSLVEKGCGTAEENETKLRLLLDKLALAQHFAACKFDEKQYPDAPETIPDLPKLVADRFPKYGFYNDVEDVTTKVGDTKVSVGDAIDDLADIARNLSETKWCWENNSPEDGLWHFKFSFDSHWSRHLRGLQNYLLNFEQRT